MYISHVPTKTDLTLSSNRLFARIKWVIFSAHRTLAKYELGQFRTAGLATSIISVINHAVEYVAAPNYQPRSIHAVYSLF